MTERTRATESLVEGFQEDVEQAMETLGPELVWGQWIGFTCGPCGFRGSTQPHETTLEFCQQEGVSPEEILADEAAMADSQPYWKDIENKVSAALPAWQAEAARVPTYCQAALLEGTCHGSVQIAETRPDIPPES